MIYVVTEDWKYYYEYAIKSPLGLKQMKHVTKLSDLSGLQAIDTVVMIGNYFDLDEIAEITHEVAVCGAHLDITDIWQLGDLEEVDNFDTISGISSYYGESSEEAWKEFVIENKPVPSCKHEYIGYYGMFETFEYCTKCDQRKK